VHRGGGPDHHPAPFVKHRLMQPAASFETSVMEHVESCLRLNFAKGVSLDELAKMSGYHPAYLCRKFKEKKGLPPRTHLNEYRIRTVKELLLAGKGAAETASLGGFAARRVVRVANECRIAWARTLSGGPPSRSRPALP